MHVSLQVSDTVLGPNVQSYFKILISFGKDYYYKEYPKWICYGLHGPFHKSVQSDQIGRQENG
jgi:hypothetical protein